MKKFLIYSTKLIYGFIFTIFMWWFLFIGGYIMSPLWGIPILLIVFGLLNKILTLGDKTKTEKELMDDLENDFKESESKFKN
jgi:hypothetical protein